MIVIDLILEFVFLYLLVLCYSYSCDQPDDHAWTASRSSRLDAAKAQSLPSAASDSYNLLQMLEMACFAFQAAQCGMQGSSSMELAQACILQPRHGGFRVCTLGSNGFGPESHSL